GKSKMMRRRVGARIGPAQAATVSQRVLDFAYAPALLVEHRVVDDAANRKLGILLDRIVLQILIAPISIQEKLPFRIAFANAATECDGHGGRFDIERLVVFDDADRLLHVERRPIGFNRLKKQSESERI